VDAAPAGTDLALPIMFRHWNQIRRSAVAATLAAAVLIAAVGCGSTPAPATSATATTTPPPEKPERIEADVEVIATGLEIPWGLAFLPDGTALVTERGTARILSVDKNRRVRVVQKVPGVVPSGEGGLLGIAVSPNYDRDKLVYIYYTTTVDNRVARLRLGGRPEPILTGIPRGANNNGGRIAFGLEQLLYIGTGDVDDLMAPQDKASLAGKILRVEADGKPPYDNPDPRSPVYTIGHRNVQGLAWDEHAQMYAAEFGEHEHDELNRIVPGGNYGWPDVEGPGGAAPRLDPVATWTPKTASPSGIAISGRTVYLACLAGQRLLKIDQSGRERGELLVEEYGRLRTVVVAPDRSLWVLTSNRDGRGGPPGDDDDRILRVTVR
jgi:glucose/arabinose dehydrogenase